MAAITIKKIPEPIYENLKMAAKTHHRSINGEILSYLEKELSPIAIPTETRIAKARALRKQVGKNQLTSTDIKQAIEDGRP